MALRAAYSKIKIKDNALTTTRILLPSIALADFSWLFCFLLPGLDENIPAVFAQSYFTTLVPSLGDRRRIIHGNRRVYLPWYSDNQFVRASKPRKFTG